MKILDIHAGITDQDIFDFLYHKEKEAEKNIIEEAEVFKKMKKLEKRNMKNMDLNFLKKIYGFF